MQQALPPASSVLQSHAKDTKGHFELARSMFKRVSRGHACMHVTDYLEVMLQPVYCIKEPSNTVRGTICCGVRQRHPVCS